MSAARTLQQVRGMVPEESPSVGRWPDRPRSRERGRRGCALPGLLALALLTAWASLAAAAGEPPSLYVMLLLDTQERMNLVPGTGEAPAAACATGKKSAWLVTQEALAGTLSNFACTATLAPAPGGAQVSYPALNAAAVFNMDGLVSTFATDVRFGMMTMDATPSNSPTFDGAYSYGSDVVNGGVALNLGARSQLAAVGPLTGFTAFTAQNKLSNIDHNAALLQLLQSRAPAAIVPYGADGSLAAFLDDARTFFRIDPSVLSGAVGAGDPLADCRTKVVFLVSGGTASGTYDALFNDLPNAASPFGSADQQAAALLINAGVRTYVFYFSDGGAQTQQRMNAIAMAGGTLQAVAVTDTNSLRNAMAAVIGETRAGIHSQTRTASAFDTFDPAIAQIQTSASYTIPATGRWYGHLEFATYRCGEDRPYESHDFGEILDGHDVRYRKQVTRAILTPINDVLTTLGWSLNPASGLTLAQLGLGPGDGDKATALVEFMKGRGSAYYPLEHALGAIVHSSPQPVGPPSLELPYPSYEGALNGKDAFKMRYARRPTMVYVGANDGLLHAFAIAAPDAQLGKVGTEIFGYVPRALQSSLRAFEDVQTPHDMVDGTPLVRDVRLRAAPTIAAENERWISALLGGGRNGGRFYYALNVSDPLAVAVQPTGNTDTIPFFLWEMDALDPGADPTVKQRLGMSYGRPATGSVLIADNGTLNELAVAFIPGGKKVDGAGNEQTGLALWVVQIEPQTGLSKGRPRILRAFLDGDPTVDPMQDPIVGTPVPYGALPGQPTTRVFVTDQGGRLWRADTSATDPSRWTMRVFYDPYRGQESKARRPAFYEPSLALRPTGELVVIYGTGDPDATADIRSGHKLISLTEVLSVNGDGSLNAGYGTTPNWTLGFQKGEQLIAQPVIFDSTVFFASYRYDATDACQIGETRLWGIDYVGIDPTTDTDVVRRFPTNVDTTVVDPTHGVWQETSPPPCDEAAPVSGEFGKEALYCVMPAGTQVFGLEISRTPTCPDFFGEWTGQAAGGQNATPASGKPVLTVQTGRVAPLGALGLPVQGSTATAKLRRYLQQPRISTMPLMWGVVYDD